MYLTFVFHLSSTVCDASYLGVTKRHVGTQTTDVGLAGIIQLWFQTNILRLREREREREEEKQDFYCGCKISGYYFSLKVYRFI